MRLCFPYLRFVSTPSTEAGRVAVVERPEVPKLGYFFPEDILDKQSFPWVDTAGRSRLMRGNGGGGTLRYDGCVVVTAWRLHALVRRDTIIRWPLLRALKLVSPLELTSSLPLNDPCVVSGGIVLVTVYPTGRPLLPLRVRIGTPKAPEGRSRRC